MHAGIASLHGEDSSRHLATDTDGQAAEAEEKRKKHKDIHNIKLIHVLPLAQVAALLHLYRQKCFICTASQQTVTG